MSFANYTELQTEISDFMHRSDLDSKIPTFITLAESKLNRILRIREQEQLSYTTVQTTATNRRVALPTGFIEFLSLKIKGENDENTKYKPLQYLPPERAHEQYTSAGVPTHYTIRKDLELNCVPSSNQMLRMHYLKQWDIATDTTNWLLTNHPDAYLYGALAAAASYIKDDKRVPMWIAGWDMVQDELNEVAERSRNHAELPTPEGLYGYGFNILTGGY